LWDRGFVEYELKPLHNDLDHRSKQNPRPRQENSRRGTGYRGKRYVRYVKEELVSETHGFVGVCGVVAICIKRRGTARAVNQISTNNEKEGEQGERMKKCWFGAQYARMTVKRREMGKYL
jgi:hypothetical protein